MKHSRVQIAVLLVVGAICAIGAHWPNDAHTAEQSNSQTAMEVIPTSLHEVTDTVFVLCDQYIVVDLDKQWMYLHRRNDSTVAYPVSSGNPRIEDGMHTPRGLYTVQTKNPLGISRQFDNARLWHWIGFNGNIGFHGLDGRGYYRYLGKKASSHGCLRMAREDIKTLFYMVPYGTPVLVHNERAVVNLAFADSADNAQDYVLIDTLSSEIHDYFDTLVENAVEGKKMDRSKRFAMSGTTKWRRESLPVGVVELPISGRRFLSEF